MRTIPPLSPAESARFWSKVDRAGGMFACWPWRASRHKSGRGYFGVAGNVYWAHRVAYTETYGAIPAGLVLRHDCDNPWCCNPAHLRPGTQRDNLQDAVKRKRTRRNQARSGVLTDDQVREIRRRHKAGERQTELATAFGVHKTTINSIVHRINWSFLDDD